MTLKIYTDGGAQPNPGIAAFAYVILIDDRLAHQSSGIVGINTTNNIAEYTAMIEALTYLMHNKHLITNETDIHLISDSQLLINQLNGSYKINNPTLKKLHNTITILGQALFTNTHITLTWNPRENHYTSICDQLCDSEILNYKNSNQTNI
jgi:ribonuclease HI